MDKITIDLCAKPMSSQDIERMREDMRSVQPKLDKVQIYAPLSLNEPGMMVSGEFLFSLYCNTGDLLSDVPGALARDWTGARRTREYAEKVRQQGRELITAEVAVMDRHVAAVAKFGKVGDALFKDMGGTEGIPVVTRSITVYDTYADTTSE